MTMSLWKALILNDTLCTIYAKLIELPFRYGFSYPRWEKSVQVMLQKRSLPYLSKLRIIELFELDLNAFHKLVLGRAYPKYEKKHSLNHPESYVAVKGMSAHGALNSVQLAMEHSRVTRIPMLIAPKDATGCFDLMRPELVKFIQDSKGIPKNTTKATTMVLSKMKKYVCTEHGTSTQYIQKTSENNIGGIGQGAGNGPQGSTCQTGLLKTIHGKMCPGMNITHPVQTNNIRIY